MWNWVCCFGSNQTINHHSEHVGPPRRPATKRDIPPARNESPVFTDIPPDLKQFILPYLSTREVLRLQQTSKGALKDLGVIVRPPFRILGENYWTGENTSGESLRIATVIPIFDQRRTHSVTLKFTWRDQGQSNNGNSCVMIVAHPSDANDVNMYNGKVVAQSCLARKTIKRDFLSFRPERGSTYYLWIKVEGGDKALLHIDEVNVYNLVIDNNMTVH